MMTPVIDFVDDGNLDDHDKAGIRGALRQIVWQHPVAAITLLRSLSGGASGARVFEIRVRHGNSSHIRVVKLAGADETNREWESFRRWIAPYANTCCVLVRERTPDRLPGDPAWDWTALVYDHAAQFAGAPAQTVRTLEDLAGDGLPTLTTAVEDILDRAAGVLHERCDVVTDSTSLSLFNTELGESLTIEVERIEGDGIHHGRGASADHILLHHDEVVRRTSRGAEGDIAVGTRVAMADLRLRWDGDALFADGVDIKVALRPAVRSGFDAAVLADDARVSVWGRVTSTRGLTRRHQVTRAMGMHDHAFADPFAVLPEVLCEPRRGRVLSVCHGDLNLRNVIAVGDRLFLIDYARTGRSAQQLDFCWLEIGVLRDVLKGHHIGELLHLQRCLALATVLLELVHKAANVADLVAPLTGPGTADAFRLLQTIRLRAWARYPKDAGPRLSEEYLRHLLLSAHRTLKWPQRWHTPEQIRAATVAAAVATEWLDCENPFRYWERETLSAALVVLAPAIDLRHDAAVRLVGQILRAIEQSGPPDDEAEDAVAILATRLAGCRCGPAARSLLITWSPAEIVDLSTEPSGPGVVATLLNAGDVTLAGPPGSGKSTVTRQLVRRLASGLATGDSTRVPLLVDDADAVPTIAGLLTGWNLETVASEAFALGAVHVVVDVGPMSAAPAARAFVSMVRECFPRTRLVVCDRVADPASRRVEVLTPLSQDDMVTWLQNGARDRTSAEHLLRLLLDDPRWTWVDLHRPRWLALVAGYVDTHGLPGSPPAPYEVLASEPARADTFQDPHLHRSYLRARELAEGDPARVVDAVRGPADGDALRILVTLPEADADLIRMLVDAVASTRPVMAAELLRAAGTNAAEFAARKLAVLRDPEAGPVRWRIAGHALSVLGGSSGLAALAQAALDPAVPPPAARAALFWLGQLFDASLGPRQRRSVAAVVADVIRRTLDAPELASRRQAVVELLTRTGLPGFELYAAQLVTEAQPWPLVRGAVTALRARGTILPPPMADVYIAAAQARLTEIDGCVLSALDAAAVRAEKAELIAELTPDASLPWLLSRRFAYDAHRHVVEEVNRRLVASTPEKDLVRDVTGKGEVRALAAAHRLLRDAPDTAAAVLTDLPVDCSPPRLQMASAAVCYASAPQLNRVAGRFGELVAHVEADRLPGMAGLMTAIHRRDPALGVRLAHAATMVLVERDVSARHNWPWADAIARIYGDVANLDRMMCDGGENALAAVGALAARDFHRSCRPGSPRRLTPQARLRLLGLPRTADWALAAGAATLVEALPELPALTGGPDRVVRRSSSRYGLLDVAVAADVLAVLGYLARAAHDSDVLAHEVATAYEFLREFDVGDRHSSVAIGRLIGLAYLGEWLPILRADLSDPRIADVARFAIGRWLPGPATPPGCESPLDVVDWVSARLREDSLSARRRWVLDDLTERAGLAEG